MSTTSVQFRLKRRTTAQWAAAPNLAEGEPGYEIGTGQLKIGTGSATWAQLPYVSNVRTNDTAGWNASTLVLGTGEIGYESNTGYMKVGDGSKIWNALSYTATFSLTNITPLLGAPGFNGASGSATSWYRRIVPPANKIDQLEFYPMQILMDPSGTATIGGNARVYDSSGVDNVGAIKTTSYPISFADWNTAAAAGASIKATLQAPFTANGSTGYIVGAHQLAGYGLTPSSVRLNNVTISASVGGSATISWTGVTGALTAPAAFDRRVLYGTGILSGTYLNYTSGSSGTITNVNYPSAVSVSSVMVINMSLVRAVLTNVTISPTSAGVSSISWGGSSTSTGGTLTGLNASGLILSNRSANIGSAPAFSSLPNSPSTGGSGTISAPVPYATTVSIPSLDIVETNAGYKRSNDYVGVVVANVSTFTINSNVIISGTTASNGTYLIKSINTATNTLLIAAPTNIRPYIGSTGKAKPVGGVDVDIVSIYTPGTVKVTLASSVSGATVYNIDATGNDTNGSTLVISGATGGNNVASGYSQITSTDGNSFTMVNLNAVTQATGGTATISGVNGGAAVNIQSITPLAPMDTDPTRFFSITYDGALSVAGSRPRNYTYTPFVNLYTTDVVASSGSGVDAVSTATVTSALSQVSTVTSDDAVNRVAGGCSILLPSNLYLLKRAGEEYSLYNKPLVTGQWYDVGSIDYSGTSPGKQFNECLRFTPSSYAVNSSSLTATVRDYKWNQVATKSSTVNVVNTTNSNVVRYLSLGDSITRGLRYQERVMGLNYISSNIASIPTTTAINVASTSGMAVGDSLRIVGATTASNDTPTYTIATIVSSTQITVSGGTLTVQGASGGVVVIGAVASSRVTGVSTSAGVTTVTVSSATGFTVGRSVTIALYTGSTSNNVHGRIDSVNAGANTFTIKNETGTTDGSVIGSAIVGNVSTSGTRVDSRNSTSVGSMSGRNTGYSLEGRGGWALTGGNGFYSTAFRRADGFDSPFIFPTDLSGTVYRGNTEFWKRAVATEKGAAFLYRLNSPAPSANTSVTITGAASSIHNVTADVVTSSGNDFTIFISDTSMTSQAFPQGTATWSGGSGAIQSISYLRYDYQGYGRAAREGLSGDTYAYNDSGYPTAPADNDRVFDPLIGSGTMRRWNDGSSAWVTDSATYTWAFNYGKYLARYPWAFQSGAETPTVISILLGANDFNSSETEPLVMTTWIADLRTMITNIRSVGSPPEIVILLPSMSSTQDGYGDLYNIGTLAERARRNFQTESDAIITEFDNSTDRSNNIFVSVFGAGIDPVYGSTTVLVAPNKYITDNTRFIRRTTDGIHPNTEGLYQAGDWLAATIQAIR